MQPAQLVGLWGITLLSIFHTKKKHKDLFLYEFDLVTSSGRVLNVF
uniref:Uncharacterized protein n=1 Tax=Rhizophora mucronata TaxID=61149 RepID=A0A2P2KTK7_RHIMU